ncbi:MAG: hypothetical protein FJX54_03370 [Alphaproteobacteria bacterium]|nr:hypothetical protein [Alphaproteobacteria bacterium]
MRDDLLDAQASVDWAVAQIPVLERRIADWMGSRPYELVMEDDPKTGEKLMVAYLRATLDPLAVVEAGAIINAIRSSLDLVAASLARRNGKPPSKNTHFPIFRSIHDFADPLEGIESKEWLSKSEIAKIKALRPYHGGDPCLWLPHQLDILRKHKRLIAVDLSFQGMRMNAYCKRRSKNPSLKRPDCPVAPE